MENVYNFRKKLFNQTMNVINCLEKNEKTNKDKIYEIMTSGHQIGFTMEYAKEYGQSTGMSDEELREFIEQELNKLITMLTKYDNNYKTTKVGIELEYAGCGGETESELVEDCKEDGSVNDDGREYNLCPVDYATLNNTGFRKELKKFMEDCVDEECMEDWSAGMHVHVSADGLDADEGRIVMRAFTNVFASHLLEWSTPRETYTLYQTYDNELLNEDEIDMYEDCWDREVEYDSANAVIKKKDADSVRINKKVDWMQCLYSTSEREGFEPYGLGTNGTRGWTRHDTIELRVWRTTTDWRKIITRAKFAVWWINFICKWTKLASHGYVDWEDVPDIWEELKNNNEIRNAYMYMAFFHTNGHVVGGMKEQQLMEKLNVQQYQVDTIKKKTRENDINFMSSEKEFAEKFYNAI